MNVLLTVIVVYFLIGLLSLAILEIATHRVSKRLKSASVEAQVKLSDNGSYVGSKTALMMTLLALILFYPFAIYAAIRWR